MPYARPEYVASGALFYSYDVGCVHMIVMSAYEDLSETSPQTIFLKADLAALNRTRTPWVVAAYHPPVYNSNAKHYLEAEAFRVAYEPLLLAARVNAVITGHVHAFQRTKMVADNQVVASGGMYHFLLGMGGKELYQQWREPLSDYPWVAARDATFWGYSVLTANTTVMTIDVFCSVGETCKDGDRVDTFTFPNQLNTA